ncbi:SDR family NAD(P)-dependent oxidoreductase [Nonomuraea jabiensis]|uniref:SDR family NAD(P)-dependent oxidoreductase n=1 Tax=Nonomuraea jabiensis TaxID=882448 RepID=UPI0034447432
MRGLQGKRVLVAGSATGIGAATAKRLGQEGARVYLGDINEAGVGEVAAAINAAGGSAASGRFDLADEASIEAMVDSAVTILGGLDGVANIAADMSRETWGRDFELVDLVPDIWEKTLKANLLGYALIGKYAIPRMIASGGGAIVNTSSGSSWSGEPSAPAYAASKAGINSLTRHIARAYASQGIRANTVAPGVVLTESLAAFMTDELEEKLLATCTIPRLGRADDIASTICYLLSDDTSWVTGQAWSVNGGQAFRE